MDIVETAEIDNNTTAATTTASETTGDDLIVADYDSEAVKPVNMKLKAAVKALLHASMSEDGEMRNGATQSLVKLGVKHPLNILTEWLCIWNGEMERVSKAANQKKNSNDNENIKISKSFLIQSLKSILKEMTSCQSIDGGDLRHRAILGQIISGLVDEMILSKVNQTQDISLIQDILVILAANYMDKVMDVLLLHYQPNSSKIYICVLSSFDRLAEILPTQIVAFSKTIIDISVQISKLFKQNDIELKAIFCSCMHKIFEAIQGSIKNGDEAEKTINKEQFTNDADGLFELVLNSWMAQAKDPTAKSKFLMLLATLTSFLSTELIYEKGTGYLLIVTNLYKKSYSFEVSVFLYNLLEVLTSHEILLMEVILDPLLTVMFQQVCIFPEVTQTSLIQNQLEILKCYDILFKTGSEKILHQMLTKLEASDEKTRVGALTVISNILNKDKNLSSDKTYEITEKILTRLNETTAKGKKLLLQIILQLTDSKEPNNNTKRKVFIDFILQNCGLNDSDNIGRESENVLQLLTTTEMYQSVLWEYLIDHLLNQKSLKSAAAICKSLSSLSKLKSEKKLVSFSFDNLKSDVTPYKLFARLIVAASDAQEKDRAIDILTFLQHFCPNINHHLVSLWSSRIPLLVHFLEQNSEIDHIQWTNWLCAFTTDSVNQIGMEEWSCHFAAAIIDQLQFVEYQSFTIRCCAHVITVMSSRQIIQQFLDKFFEKCLEDSLDVSDLLVFIEFAATKHLELVLNKLESLYNTAVVKKNKFLNFIKEKMNDDKKTRENSVLFICLSEAIKHAPLKELEFCAEGIIKKFLYPCLTNVKDSKDKNILHSGLKCVSVLAATTRLLLPDSPDYKLYMKEELLQVSLGILQDDSMTESVKMTAVETLTSLIHLPPNVGQLTRFSILRSSFALCFDGTTDEEKDLRKNISNLLIEFSRQDQHSSVVEEIFQLLEPFTKKKSPISSQALALDIFLESLTLFRDCASSEETFSPSLMGIIIPGCFDENTKTVSHQCFSTLVDIYSQSHHVTDNKTDEDLPIAESIIAVVKDDGDLITLLIKLCDYIGSDPETCLAMHKVVVERAPSLVPHIPKLVTKLVGACDATDQEIDDNIPDMIHHLAGQDLDKVVSTLLSLANGPSVNSIWSCLASDQQLSAKIMTFLLELMSFDKILQSPGGKQRDHFCTKIIIAMAVILEARKLKEFCQDKFSEIFTKLLLLLCQSEPQPPSDCFQWSLRCLRNMFSTLDSLVVSSNIVMDPDTNNTLDIVTRMMTTICYHSPHFLTNIVTGITPFTVSESIPDSVKTVNITIMAVILTEKANNDQALVSAVVEVLQKCLNQNEKTMQLSALAGLTGITNCNKEDIIAHSNNIIKNIVQSCNGSDDPELILSVLSCINIMLDAVDVDDAVANDVHILVKGHLYSKSEDHQALALNVTSILNKGKRFPELELELMVLSLLLSTSDHNNTRETVIGYLTNTAQDRNSSNMMTYLRSVEDSKVSIDLLIQTILSDEVLLTDKSSVVIQKCFEYNQKVGTTTTQKNGIVIISKLIGFNNDTIEEEVICNVIESFIDMMEEESDLEVRRAIAEYLGLVMLTTKISG